MTAGANVERWSSRRAFVLAAMGSAIGLGNIWRFPYVTGENGGGVFVLVYLACIALVGVPIMIAEVAMGRRGRGSPVHAMQRLSSEQGLNRYWQFIGYLSVFTAFMLISVFSGVAGWSIAYIIPTLTGALGGMTPEAAGAEFAALVASPARVLGCHAMFLLLALAVVMGGVQAGIERAVKWLMPMLFVILITIVSYALLVGDAVRAFRYLFTPNLAAFSADGMLMAIGQAFLSLSVATGSLFAYGAYVSSDQPIAGPVGLTAIADTAVALLAGFAIFPLVFAYGLAPQEGPGLVFVTLTVAFGEMPGGNVVGALFFLLLTIATWTSVISSFEPVVVWITEVTPMGRVPACLLTSAMSWLVGMVAMLSFNIWADVRLFQMNIFELLAGFTTNILLPVGAFLIAVFAGWKLAPSVAQEAIGNRQIHLVWLAVIRFVVPVLVAVIFVDGIGIV